MTKKTVSDVVDAVRGSLFSGSGKGDKASANPTQPPAVRGSLFSRSGKGDKASANPTQPPDLAAKGATASTASGAPFLLSTSDQAEAAMNLGDDDLQLLCVIEGETEVFPIDVEGALWHNPKYMFSHLKKRIQEERNNDSLAGVGAHILKLWKPSEGNFIIAKPKHALCDRVASARESGEELDPTDNVLTVFPDQPPLDRLHIVVRKPDTALQQKRPLSEPNDMFERSKRSKTVTTTPSTLGQRSAYESLQRNPSERIFDDRPEPDPDFPPVALLYEGFGHFLDIMGGRRDVPGLAEIDIVQLHEEVDEFATKMNRLYKDETGRREVGLSCLRRIFSAHKGINIPRLEASAIGSATSDGHITGPHDAAIFGVEFKNEITQIAAAPQIELIGYVARLNVKGAEEHRQLYQQWRVPCLGLTIVGCDLRFHAIVMIDHRFRLVSLTPLFSCLRSGSNGDDRTSLYMAFTAALVLQARILRDIEKLTSLPSGPILDHQRRLPAVSKLRKYPESSGSSDDYFTFEIQHLFDKQPSRFLYVAEMPDKQPILIKFARRYSIELHELCAGSGHAPRILAFERLPGGWYAVAMEYIESGVPITRSPLLPAHRDRWEKELTYLVDKIHSKGLVHGDLRDANILCKGDSVMLIDFDWGGKDGEVFYPTGNLNLELREGRVSNNDLRITKEDDRRVLTRTVAKLWNISV